MGVTITMCGSCIHKEVCKKLEEMEKLQEACTDLRSDKDGENFFSISVKCKHYIHDKTAIVK